MVESLVLIASGYMFDWDLTFLVPVASGYTLTGRYTLVSLPVTFACLPGKGGCAETARLVA